MKHLLRIIFESNKKAFLQFAVEDLFGQIPAKVSDPGVTVLMDQRAKMEKWFMWMAYVLQRRMLSNPREAEMIHGMLLQIKMMAQVIGSSTMPNPPTEGLQPAAKARAEREAKEAADLTAAQKGIDDFLRPKQNDE